MYNQRNDSNILFHNILLCCSNLFKDAIHISRVYLFHLLLISLILAHVSTLYRNFAFYFLLLDGRHCLQARVWLGSISVEWSTQVKSVHWYFVTWRQAGQLRRGTNSPSARVGVKLKATCTACWRSWDFGRCWVSGTDSGRVLLLIVVEHVS